MCAPRHPAGRARCGRRPPPCSGRPLYGVTELVCTLSSWPCYPAQRLLGLPSLLSLLSLPASKETKETKKTKHTKETSFGCYKRLSPDLNEAIAVLHAISKPERHFTGAVVGSTRA